MSFEQRSEISEFELMAYVDRQLDARQCLEVEDFLSQEPRMAARVMADMRTRDALFIAGTAPSPAPSSRTAEALRRLEAAVARQRSLRMVRWPVVFAAVAGLGWVALRPVPSTPPSIIDDAVMAHRTTQLRAGMLSQVETAALNTDEMGRAADVRLPAIPNEWRITDVQLYPSDDGPGVQVAVDLPGPGGAMSLFAVESSDDIPDKPALTARGAESVAYWRRGHTAFAITGANGKAVSVAAIDVADNPLL